MGQTGLAVTTLLVAAFSFSGCGSADKPRPVPPAPPPAAPPAEGSAAAAPRPVDPSLPPLLIGESHGMPGDPIDVAAEVSASSLQTGDIGINPGRWCPGTTGKGTDESLRIRLLEPLAIDEIQLYAEGEKYVKQATIALDDGRQITVPFEDTSRQRNIVVGGKVGWLEIHASRSSDKFACLDIAISTRVDPTPRRVQLVTNVTPAQLAQLPAALEQMTKAIAHCDATLANLATDPFVLSSMIRRGGAGELALDHDALLAECRAGSLPPFPATSHDAIPGGLLRFRADGVAYAVAFRAGGWRLTEVSDRRRDPSLPPAPKGWDTPVEDLRRFVAVSASSQPPWCVAPGAPLELTFPRGALYTGVRAMPVAGTPALQVSVNGGAPLPLLPNPPYKDLNVWFGDHVVTRLSVGLAAGATEKVCLSNLELQNNDYLKQFWVGKVPVEALDRVLPDLIALGAAGCDRTAVRASYQLPFTNDRARFGKTELSEDMVHDQRRCTDAACVEKLCRSGLVRPTTKLLQSAHVDPRAEGKVEVEAFDDNGAYHWLLVFTDRWRVESATYEPMSHEY